MTTHWNKDRRRGAAILEFAVVAVIFFLLLFGIIEYSLIVYYRNTVVNAAREGARYGVVNMDDTAIETDTKNKVKSFLFGLDSKLKNYGCDVYRSDATGNKIGNADAAAFGEYLAVHVYGDYQVRLPGLMFLKSTVKVQSKCLMCSEAN